MATLAVPPRVQVGPIYVGETQRAIIQSLGRPAIATVCPGMHEACQRVLEYTDGEATLAIEVDPTSTICGEIKISRGTKRAAATLSRGPLAAWTWLGHRVLDVPLPVRPPSPWTMAGLGSPIVGYTAAHGAGATFHLEHGVVQYVVFATE